MPSSDPFVIGSGLPVPPPVWPRTMPTVRIESDIQAIQIAQDFAHHLKQNAAERERSARFPLDELNRYSASGLWGITVPRAYGGAGVSYATLGTVVQTIAAADGALAQIAQNHWAAVAVIASCGTPEQQKELFSLILDGKRCGNAFSERGNKKLTDLSTHLVPQGDHVLINGKKYYCTGALAADLVPIVAVDKDGVAWLAIADRDTDGLTVLNDWSAFGQRQTGSGTVLLDNVKVPLTRVLPAWKAYIPESPRPDSAISQFIQAAIDGGIAQGALEETVFFVKNRTRPWIDSNQDNAHEDPYTRHILGGLFARLSACRALLDVAGKKIDAALTHPTPETVASAQVSVAEAKIFTTELAIDATNRLFELAGTASTDTRYNFDRYWRNARTHTLHDPIRWKYAIVGNYYLNGTAPPLHAWS
ncbi:SfnB family sulfur acquisition oxidoreductase [Acetobacter tropicalis]|uniref:Acyl-CoA dehydrogenase n=1 Tax=Acetobacter tropicalis TaxID=104102 RepID=A0A094YG99_9PROT|nr:SfnB family sulfur acquisition oxidoreductase [Acetobacter tropicalis]KAA8383588.1 SfnB family sulfur acquisition oxidoreductase [Acetobacter tropicalis]KAA8389371.1 SfnB family sulfur acquisition oxidoreductase [Acetobacter tropicalis]KGB21065.1 Acyl-CoA dehydrogenase [Acetobacter tropicalis]MBC9008708.1 SfnB family sulfur acquisition oxidoreductase [Acetobacter tropicalis]MDO8173007.1 SfnB family sulfur acquisition oxidoreductase [Acetobacter tropicalis]